MTHYRNFMPLILTMVIATPVESIRKYPPHTVGRDLGVP